MVNRNIDLITVEAKEKINILVSGSTDRMYVFFNITKINGM
jgi:hypothetical protein